jgi:translation elongation factor EF-G
MNCNERLSANAGLVNTPSMSNPSGPNITYLETIRETSAAVGEFHSRSSARSKYTHVVIRIEPNPGRGLQVRR